MSCHLSHRLTTIHRAVSMALLYSVGYAALVSSAQAATIGKTVVTSAQHEPLVASIMVTDIKTADFSASLANSTIYQQMGLTPTDSMTVRFQPTSATTGQVFITTTKPVSKPFADVVLAINDGTQRNVIPKTLLMPLNDSLPITSSKNIVTGAKKPNLPVVSVINAQPLTVRQGTPPPLLLSAYKSSTSDLAAAKLPARDIQIPNIQAPTVSSSLPAAVTTTTQSNTTVYAPSRLNNDNTGSINSLDKNSLNVSKTTDYIPNNKISANNTAATSLNILSSDNNEEGAVTDRQFDILNIQITRQIQFDNERNTGIVAARPLSPKATLPPTLNNQASTVQANSANTIVASAPRNSVPTSDTSSSSVTSNASTVGTNTAATVATAPNQPGSAEVNYTVQRNDSLWVIAQQIAEKNNLDIQTVMKEIKSQNPSAFINKNADQLKADAQLSLPNYDVLPSQQKLEAAISAQRQYNRKANIPIAKKPTTPKPTSKPVSKTASETTRAAKHTEKPAVTKTQTLPKAQFSVIAPGHQGSADGTKTKAGMATGNGLSTDVLTILKSSRQSTASQAQGLSKTNGMLDSYTRKLQLQNQKLAELQARLKKLRNQ
ncbi:type IV pilus assembly protein FimV [Psychrobacter sp. DAB_AL62B]|uniref:type IV pilus assembly protein FimV n=1 Tax=Psychrobacter sp. DAB_AL62B TaxID=1028420 RepID=UPI0023816A2C|nr:peptigoglycan-binding protein LysM [Psychrobacter sp. DAB_AL62B]MDE4456095.1 peptigoglycan-binding protein LysM [Psychrobacter sp. DAB_AL62B]